MDVKVLDTSDSKLVMITSRVKISTVFRLFVITPVITHRIFQVRKLIGRSLFNLTPDCAFLISMQSAIILAAFFISYVFNQLIVVYSEYESCTFLFSMSLRVVLLTIALENSTEYNPNKDYIIIFI